MLATAVDHAASSLISPPLGLRIVKPCSPILPRLLLAVLVVVHFEACSLPTRRAATKDRAFIRYWPPPQQSGDRLRLAVKDLIDVKGVVTTAGSQVLGEEPSACFT